jgi:hypothetical protein
LLRITRPLRRAAPAPIAAPAPTTNIVRVILADAGGTPRARTLWLLASSRVVKERDVAEYRLGVVCWIEYAIPHGADRHQDLHKALRA